MAPRQVLIFVQISTHFVEMVRVADLLLASNRYRPVMLFMAPYAGHLDHVRACRSRGILCICPDDLWRYLPPVRARRRLTDRIAILTASASALLARFVRGAATRARRVLMRAYHSRAGKWARPLLRPGARVLVRNARHVRRLAGAVETAFEGWGRLFGRSLRALDRGMAAIGSWTGRVSRRGCLRLLKASGPLLRVRIAPARELAAARRVPRPVAALALLFAGIASLAGRGVMILLRPPLRAVLAGAFGFLYRRWPEVLPPDMQAQRFVWQIAPGLIRAHDIALLVVPEDNFYYFTNILIEAVHEAGGRAIIVPFTIVNTLEWSEAFHQLPSHDARVLANMVVSAAFPRWRHRYKGTDLTMPAQQVLSNEYLGTAPPIPWLINSGFADALAVESAFMDRYYRNAGIELRRLHLVGSLADDVLFRLRANVPAARRHLYESLGLPLDRPMILCALPPNQLGGAGRAACEFRDYASVVRAFLQPLEQLCDEFNVVISMHPRITNAEAALVSGRVRIAATGVSDLVPLADIYVASCSATIRLAMSCAIPVVNYDVYGYAYDDYDGVAGVTTIAAESEYVAALLRLAGSESARAAVRERMREDGTAATLDGQAGARLLALMDDLTVHVTAAPLAHPAG